MKKIFNFNLENYYLFYHNSIIIYLYGARAHARTQLNGKQAAGGSRAPGQMSLRKLFCPRPGKPAEVSQQAGSEVESDYDREVSDGELEGVLQLL